MCLEITPDFSIMLIGIVVVGVVVVVVVIVVVVVVGIVVVMGNSSPQPVFMCPESKICDPWTQISFSH